MELKKYLSFIWRWLWLIALCGAAGAGIAFLVSSQETPIYAASTLVMVNQDQGAFARPSPSLEDLRARQRLSQTIMELMRVRPVLRKALDDSGIEMPLGTLANRVSTDDINETELFNLIVRDTDRERAVVLADAIVQSFKSQERTLLDNPYAQGSALVVIEPARASVVPVSPNYQRNIILGAAIGIFLAIIIGYLIDYFNTRIKDEDDMDRLGGMRPLSTIGKLGGSSPAAMLVTLTDAHSPNAEAYRMFRTHLDTFPLETGVHTLAVTSPGPREGRSVTAANLAVALAQTGRKVVLVDADLRRPALHEFFGLANDTGLSTVLSSDAAKVANYLRPTGVEGLRLLAGGPLSLTPAQLLGGEQFERAVEALRREADVVVFDSPALLSVVDATLLTRVADAALVVVRSGSTTAGQLKEAFAHLQQSSVNILGILLNAAPLSGRRQLAYYRDLRRRQDGARSRAGRLAQGEAGEGRTAPASAAGKTGD